MLFFNEKQNDALKFSVCDIGISAFIFFGIVTTIFSPYPRDSLTGYGGRYNGLLFYALCAAVYFIVSRGFDFEKYILYVIIAVSSAMFLMAALQKLGFDVLGFHAGLSAGSKKAFLSTIGNINFFSSFVVLLMPVSVCLYILSKSLIEKIIFCFAAALAFFGLISSGSDSGIIGAAVLFTAAFFFFSKNIQSLKNFTEIVILFFLSHKIMYALSAIFKNSQGLDGISGRLAAADATYIIIFALFILRIIPEFINTEKSLKQIQITVAILLGLSAAGLISCVIYYSVYDIKTDLGFLTQFLRFNEKWGSGRGYAWIHAFRAYGKYNIFQKFFGYGYDMFRAVLRDTLNITSTNSPHSFDSVHNEPLQHLVSAGFLGIAAYLTFVTGGIVRSIKNATKNPLTIIFALSILCYTAQGFVNIGRTMVTPLFFLMFAIAEGLNRNSNKKFQKLYLTK